MNISTILSQIDLGMIALPEFQRGYVWNREQVRGLMRSLYRRYPVGGLLVWATETDTAKARGNAPLAPGFVKLLLDGQQRVTSLYGIIRNQPPKFFEGNAQAFTRLYFNVEEETFEFYAPTKMQDNPLWISVYELMKGDLGTAVGRFFRSPEYASKVETYLNRLNAVAQIKGIDLHIEEVTGIDKTMDVVVEIFNQVNSGGTKLSYGDLALAKVCAGWPEARRELNARLKHWQDAGFDFDLDWLLRNIITIVTGQAIFSAPRNVSTYQFQNGLKEAEKTIDSLLNLVSSRLGLDHDRVLGGRYAFPVMTRYLTLNKGKLQNARDRDKLLYWYVHSFLWGRFSVSTESRLNQDLALIDGKPGSLDRLIDQLRRSRGELKVRPTDFDNWSVGARFYPLLYLLTRVCGAKNLCDGVPLSAYMLGKLSRLEVHHIFPKAVLKEHGYSRAEINALGNYCFLTQECNLQISNARPEVYFEEVERRYPGALASQWIPIDRRFWKVENYREFLAARRELLADAANTFLDGLLMGGIPEQPSASLVDIAATMVEQAPVLLSPGAIDSDDEDQALKECNEWIVSQGLPHGVQSFELADETDGRVLAIIDLAWPRGLQEGLSQPVALLLNEGDEVEDVLNRSGYRYFTSVAAFRDYVEREILALEPVAV